MVYGYVLRLTDNLILLYRAEREECYIRIRKSVN